MRVEDSPTHTLALDPEVEAMIREYENQERARQLRREEEAIIS